MKKLTFKIKAKVWVYPGKAGWHFVTIPKAVSTKIKENTKIPKYGWQSVKVAVQIGTTVWDTSIFFDSQAHTYLLPLKAAIRKKEEIEEDDKVSILLTTVLH